MLIPAHKVFLKTSATDLRKSYQTLGVVVKESFGEDPLSGWMFVFYNRSKNRLKILYWHGNGFCLWQKRLEKGRFFLPLLVQGEQKIEISPYQLQGLIQGLECWSVKEPPPLQFRIF